MDEVQRIAHERRPKVIIAGWSAYPRFLDFERFRAIADEVGAYLMVDMAHFAGLVAAGLHPTPVPHAARRHDDDPQDDRRRPRRDDPVHRGARQEDQLGGVPRAAGWPARARDRRQGRRRCGSPRPTRSASARSARSPGARAVATELLAAGGGVNVLTGGTDVHLVLCDLRESELDGQQAEDRLARDRDHRQPQRGAVRPAPAGRLLGTADRHAGAGHARPPARGLRRDRQGHRRRASAR